MAIKIETKTSEKATVTKLPGVLVDGNAQHERLYVNIDFYARQAGIQKHWIIEDGSDMYTEDEAKWLTKLKFHFPERHRAGLIISGDIDNTSDLRFSAMAGRLIRNFINAELITASDFAASVEKFTAPEASVLFIPNLYVSKNGLPSWRSSQVLDGLMARATDGKLTVGYVQSMEEMSADYGPAFVNFLTERFDRLDF